jgi:superfamily II DNA/RNA helicase
MKMLMTVPQTGDTNHEQRKLLMHEFRSGQSRVLVTTDLPTRGVDGPDVPLVINYDFPSKPDSYFSRIALCSSTEPGGVAISLVTPGEADLIRAIDVSLPACWLRVSDDA